tara:strand:+ start:152 stop:424 length:273 start_codon:yes stop_codon:yes gene_type:complete
MSTTHKGVTIQIEEDIKVNLWCHLCEYILKTSSDIESHEKNGCCHECWLTFGEGRKKEWSSGWRPDSDTLNRYKQQRRIINIDITKILGE